MIDTDHPKVVEDFGPALAEALTNRKGLRFEFVEDSRESTIGTDGRRFVARVADDRAIAVDIMAERGAAGYPPAVVLWSVPVDWDPYGSSPLNDCDEISLWWLDRAIHPDAVEHQLRSAING